MANKLEKTVKFSALNGRIKDGKADPVSDAQRASAARIKVAVDKRHGRKTDTWIAKLAEGALKK